MAQAECLGPGHYVPVAMKFPMAAMASRPSLEPGLLFMDISSVAGA